MAISFFKLKSSYHQALKEKQRIEQNLAGVQAAAVPVETVGSQLVSKRTFMSHIDGVEDYYAVLSPSVSGRLDNTLIVYFHGMGSNYMEPFVYPEGNSIATAISKRYANVCLLSCNYRKEASWGRDEAISDITQNIRELMQQYPIKRIVLMGTSMGGCVALSYGTDAPPDVKEKLAGIVSVEGAGDLNLLKNSTRIQSVKQAIETAMGGSYESRTAEYQRKSFIPNASKLPQGTRVAVVSAKQDQIVPPELQAQIVAELERFKYPALRIDVDAEHGIPETAAYIKGLEFTLGDRSN